jgi:hypothetical protein
MLRTLSLNMAGFFLMDFLLWFAAKTPRARLNVTQFVSIVFLVVLVSRLQRFRSSATAAPGQSRESLLLPCLGILSGMILWGTMLNCYFLGDDYLLLSMARSPKLELLTSVFRHGDGGIFYRPVTFMSYALDHAIWGQWPVGYHVTDLVFHFASVTGLFALLGQLGIQRRVSAITAAIFAAMPIQVEAVAWMSGRFDVLSTAFLLWTIVCYLYARSKNSILAYLLAMVLFVLAMCSKESAFVLPLLLFAIEWIVIRTKPDWRIAVVVVLSGLGFLYRLFALGGIGGYYIGGGYSIFDFSLKTPEGLFIRGPSQVLFGLNWMQPNGIMVTTVASLMAVLLLMLVTKAAWGSGQGRVIGLALIWTIITMLPAHFLLLIGSGLTNSRILYLPSVGIAVVLGQLLGALDRRRLQNFLFISLILLLDFGTCHNLAAWRWTARLAERTLQTVRELEPSPAPGTQFVFSSIPDTVRGVFFFRTGLSESLKLVYGRDDISAVRDPATPIPQQPQIRFLWKGTPGLLLQRQH